MSGWVSFHRKIEEWEWYTDPNTFRLFFHLVLKANHQDKKWRGQLIKRGQRVTSYSNLATELKLSVQQIRTSMNKLKSTNEITIKTTNNYTLVTVENYDFYQDEARKITSKSTNNSTNEQQSNNNQITTNKNDKNEEEVINSIRKLFPGTKTKAVAMKKLPQLIKKYGVEQLKKSIERYEADVKRQRANGFKELKYMNESTFWNGRYIDFLDADEPKPSGPKKEIKVVGR